MNIFGSLFGRGTPEKRFWVWFKNNSARLDDFEKDMQNVFNELQAELRKIHPDLTFQFGPKENGKREFNISADGLRELIPVVKSLVFAAPDLPCWDIKAFRQRTPGLDKVTFNKVELGSADIWFKTEPDGDKLALALCIKCLGGLSDKQTKAATFLWLDATLGEYDVMTKISGIQWESLPENPESYGLRPGKDLQGVMDQFHEK